MTNETQNTHGTLTQHEEHDCSETTCSSHAVNEAQPLQFTRSKPPVDIIESNEDVTLIADVPGATESTVDLEFENGVLRLNARTVGSNDEIPVALRQRAREYVRSFRISDELDVTGAEATVSNGVLSVRMPKKPTAVPAKITVRGA